jgi:MEDS: MEthanogen/methylotroph, DcmR Sensory domain
LTALNHTAQLFDTSDSLTMTLCQFIREGLDKGHHLLVIARARNWATVAARLSRSGWPVDRTVLEERLIAIDAETLLPKLMRGNQPDADCFQDQIGALVARLQRASGASLSVYGELVELLAEEGNFDGLGRLEQLWSELASSCSFKLLCGYSAAHFASPLAAHALREVRRVHSLVHARPTDTLSTWLLGNAAAYEPS